MSRARLSFLLCLGSHVALALNATDQEWATPFSALGCPKVTLTDQNWIWQAGEGQWPSCNLTVRGDIATMCLDANGKADYSSLYVDLKHAEDKNGCFVWTTDACPMRLQEVSRIEFDVDMTMCGDVWNAPLWLSPRPWVAPGGLSGEIDLVEGCPVGDVATNFDACTGAPRGFCHQKSWGTSWGLNGPKHFVMTLEDNAAGGTLRTQICDLDRTNCHSGGLFENFLQTVTPFLGKRVGHGFPYAMNSDIWNGYGGDPGWAGCGARNNPGSQCQYAIRNIKVDSTTGAPLFTGKCAALNGDRPAPPAPPGTLPACSDQSTYQKHRYCAPSAVGACWSKDPEEPWSCWYDSTELSDNRCKRIPVPNAHAYYDGACAYPLSTCEGMPTYQQGTCPPSSRGACWSSDPEMPWICLRNTEGLTDSWCMTTTVSSNMAANFTGACAFSTGKDKATVMV